MPVARDPIERFWEKVDRRGSDECWPWLASKTPAGYGQFFPRHGVIAMAHRFAYEQLIGPIPEGLHIDHLCRVRGCVNPGHLEPVTLSENVTRGGNAAKTHCKRGHELSGANLYIDPRERRQCKTCRREALRAFYVRMKTELASHERHTEDDDAAS